MTQNAAETSLPDTLMNAMIMSPEQLGDPAFSHVWRWDTCIAVKLPRPMLPRPWYLRWYLAW
jgi:hypothetical protein